MYDLCYRVRSFIIILPIFLACLVCRIEVMSSILISVVVLLEIDKEHLSYRTLFHSKADQNKHMTNQYLFKM